MLNVLSIKESELIDIYKVETIKRFEEIDQCAKFLINHQLWEKEYKPEAFGRMAVLEGYGVVITMTAMEVNPLRRYHEKDDPVYNDSALEAFLNFATEYSTKEYLNFEMNANGAMLSEFGMNRNRRKLKSFLPCSADCKAQIREDSWEVTLKIPMALIQEVYQREPLKSGDLFTCNFYKISEDPAIEHYASYAPIVSNTPNFHLPEFFGKAIIL